MKLATFEVIESLSCIEGKDRILMAKILEYDVMVSINDFKVGDICVYIPIDTIVDRTLSWFSFLKTDRIYIQKVGKIYSFGIAIPISTFGDLIPNPLILSEEDRENIDLGPLIGVKKYEKDINEQKKKGCPYPGFPTHYIPITDEDSLKSKKKLLTEFVGMKVDVTKKLDGSSMTLIWDNDIFIVASRKCTLYKSVGDNVEIDFDEPMVKYVKEKNLKSLSKQFNQLIIQGEFCGPKINCNRMKLTENKWFVFTIKVQEEGYFNYEKLVLFCTELGLYYVPLVTSFEVDDKTIISDFQNIADDIMYDDQIGEGIVVRPCVPFLACTIGYKNASFKVINSKYKD
jgi:RNA ligase (TIGR02306 family)